MELYIKKNSHLKTDIILSAIGRKPKITNLGLDNVSLDLTKNGAIKVNELAKALISAGLKKGDRLGIWSSNNAEWLLTQYAAAKAGVILVTINPAYRSHELEYVLGQSGCKGLVFQNQFKTSDYESMICEIMPEIKEIIAKCTVFEL